MVAPLMLLKVLLSSELCHWYTGDVPFSGAVPVSRAGALPLQMVWSAAIDPVSNAGVTVIVTVLVVMGPPHVPFCI